MAQAAVPAGTRLVWEQAEKRLDAQMRQADALDTKAGALVALHALTAGLVATTAERFQGASRWILVVVITGLLVSGGLAIVGFLIQRYDRRPAPQTMWTFGEWQEEQILLRLISTRFDALNTNQALLTKKAKFILRSLTLLSVVALVVATTAIIGLARAG